MSENGKVVLPASLRKKLGIKDGDKLTANSLNGNIVLSPKRKPKFETRIITSPITGLPVLTSGPNAPTLTSEMVAELLSDFP
ncbi:MAG: AbrB/MazE/SpoVT family DNA-binding domain-containing protein [Chloracidobacterium sp.]|nr:AbrB/MazE/SpoVT family DNA-binding domain-containing protein [Chloracidobacterium sp.]